MATDIAARGIDVRGISHAINLDLPIAPESYVHRISRTARTETAGITTSFCGLEECPYLASIEKVIRHAMPVDKDLPFHLAQIIQGPGSAKLNLQCERRLSKRRQSRRPVARTA